MKKMTGAIVVLVVCIALYITSAVLLGAGILAADLTLLISQLRFVTSDLSAAFCQVYWW